MNKVGTSQFGGLVEHAFVFAMFFVTGLAVSRLLYEGAFPHLLGLARPFPVFVLALLAAVAGLLCWRWASKRSEARTDQSSATHLSVSILAPLLINLPYLFDPAVNLVNSRLLFAVSIWLASLLLARSLAPVRSWRWLGVIFILAAVLPVYLITMPQTVGGADTFEFQVVIPQMGIAHPTGYPLYLLLGRLFTFIPLGTVAWRVNLASVVFALVALILLYAAARRLLNRPIPAVFVAVSLGTIPAFWSQAVIAEVYALHALIIAAALWIMVLLLDGAANEGKCTSDLLKWPVNVRWQRLIIALAFVIGLGLANHLTTLFLLPAAILTVLLAYGSCLRGNSAGANLILLLKALAAFLLPLLLYAYLPIRWYDLHGQSMGLGRFVQWVIGGRFQGALQLTAWLTDITRYEVVGRLLVQNWGWVNLVLIAAGLIYLIRINWRAALILFLTWLGFIFYALNYYVPDLAVFIIPAHVTMALFWGAGLTAVLIGVEWLLRWGKWTNPSESLTNILLLLLLLPSVYRIGPLWSEMQANDNSALLAWGQGVLAMPLENEAAILADSEKIAPLYYLQQAEGERPDLDIMVLPDEAAYRAELDQRISIGQTVYLARFLPGLEGIYNLRSVGPLIEVSPQPMMMLPNGIEESHLRFGPLHLAGVSLQEISSVDPDAAAITLFWQSDSPLDIAHNIYVRWAGTDFATDPIVRNGQHPAGNSYPTVAWKPQEIVPDFHLMPRPLYDQEQQVDLQVAVGPAFAQSEELAWQTVKKVTIPAARKRVLEQGVRAQNGRVLLSGLEFPHDVRPQMPLPLILTGYGDSVRDLQLSLKPIETELSNSTHPTVSRASGIAKTPFTYATRVDTDSLTGLYHLVSHDLMSASVCGWLAPETNGCILGEVNISGVAMPDGATNYEDKIALLNVDLPEKTLQPGGQLSVDLRWQSLAPLDEDYTVFIQVLDAQDQIVGQVDAWPLQGTYPTSQWELGEIIDDPHAVQLSDDLAPGQYKLQIGWYLLSTLGRMAILDDEGLPQDDKLIIADLLVP